MTKGITVELDSYRLAQYAVQLPCYICGHGNTFDAEMCQLCFAPMALAHQAQCQGVLPQMVAAVGSSGAGKTVYLGMLLDMLSRLPHRMQMLARGAFSITLQQATAAALSRCEFPVKTPSEPDRWNWMHCQVRAPHHRRPVELIMPDMAGDALFEEIDHAHTYPAIRWLLRKCGGVLVLIDAPRLQAGVVEQDYATLKLLSFLCELDTDPKSGWHNRGFALIFSKADQCENCFDDPAEFARRHTPGLFQFCEKRLKRHAFFATGVAGACAYRHLPREGRRCLPLRVEPRGVVEPFEWLMESIKA
jgi:hypothetical protein